MDDKNKQLAPNDNALNSNDPCGYEDYDGHMPPEIIDAAAHGPAIVLAILFSLIIGLIAAGFVLLKGIMWILELVR